MTSTVEAMQARRLLARVGAQSLRRLGRWPALAVADTHGLIWHATGRPGRRARELFERADAGEAAIYVPTFVLVELLETVRRVW